MIPASFRFLLAGLAAATLCACSSTPAKAPAPAQAAAPAKAGTPAQALAPRPDPRLAPPAASRVAPVDRIVAVVNDEVITQNDLSVRVDLVAKQLQRQGTQMPASDVL